MNDIKNRTFEKAINDKWVIKSYFNDFTGKKCYTIEEVYLIDYPIIYENGNIAYDRPEQLPEYVKSTFESFIKELSNPTI
jgi:hypothetical protein